MAITSPRATAQGFLVPPLVWAGNVEEHLRMLALGIQRLFDGKINATGTVTLAVSAATTTLSDRRIGRNTLVIVVPTTANAAAALSGLYQTFPNANTEAAVLNHASNAQTDKSFGYVLLG